VGFSYFISTKQEQLENLDRAPHVGDDDVDKEII
jgi:hypothetical protein